jgi:hypothetical protein
MATIAGPRPTYPRHVGTLVDVTNIQRKIALKRSPRRYNKQGATQPTLSLRDSYLEASVRATQKLQALRDSSRLALLQDQDSSASPETDMAPSGYQRLSSGPYPSASHNTSIATNVSAAGQKAELTGNQSGVIAGPVSLEYLDYL